jgi:hypothetical protein
LPKDPRDYRKEEVDIPKICGPYRTAPDSTRHTSASIPLVDGCIINQRISPTDLIGMLKVDSTAMSR